MTWVSKLAAEREAREWCRIECTRKVPGYLSTRLVLVPKSQGETFDSVVAGVPVFACVLDGTEYIDKTQIDLSPGSRLVVDLGGIALDERTAQKWQISKVEDRESATFERELKREKRES